MISEFKDEHFFLSNFFICSVTYNGATYSNNEACFQAQKTLDIKQRKQFESLDPLEARELGKKITIRPDWDSVKDQIMKEICQAKFDRNPELKESLVLTGHAPIIENNNWEDTYWGVVDGKGLNKLGKILMEIRDGYQTNIGWE